MRVLVTTDTIGGVWSYTQEMVWGLLQQGCAVALVSFGRLPSPAQQSWSDELAARFEGAFTFEASDAPLEWMEENSSAFYDGARVLERVSDAFRPELLLSSQYCFGAMDLPYPKVVVAHSDVLSWAQACRGGELQPSTWLERYKTLVGKGLRHADVVIAPTHWMLAALKAHFSISGECMAIYNGRSFQVEREPAERTLQVVTAGRLWDEAKNLRILQEIQSPIPIVVAGETSYQQSLFSESLGGAVLQGTLEQPELLTLFRRSAIYLCTSKYEPFGLAPLEAALCGCAIVAHDIPSLREVWGDAALYFRDAASLTSLLGSLCEDAELLADAQRRSTQRAEQFRADRMVKGYLDVFRSILARTEAPVHVS